MSEIGTCRQKNTIGIYERKNGTWEVRATVILADGTKKRRSFYKKAEAEAQWTAACPVAATRTSARLRR